MRQLLLILPLLLLLPACRPAPTADDSAATPEAARQELTLQRVIDGDTIEIRRGQETIRVRLVGIDAPEHNQPYGDAATEALKSLLNGQAISLDTTGTDRYGRTLATVYAGDTNLNLELVRLGLAWLYRDSSIDTGPLQAAEQAAREAGRGLWAQPKPIRPRDWRAGSRPYEIPRMDDDRGLRLED